ncbi:hypothetical protein SAMN04488564_11755 [Lentzea waywayandensis]|uniref:Uncharacterized protein n=1 Tax=Lentzea waywayandensis TaxID=84724 RepID=A0A1I6FGR6_9PSEU|nr:hypothetical protein [Lentzea waywayandensis]SFR29131.1 hypothetical protein SAMN04488564_11755 [Lentzea waywayandensis]
MPLNLRGCSFRHAQGSTVVGCTGLNPDVSPRCYNYMVYAPISVVLDTWGVSLETA